MRLTLRGKFTNWLAVVGLVFSFSGSLMLAFDSDSQFHAINSKIIGSDKLDYGWNLLTSHTALDSQGKQYTFVQQGDIGFQEVLSTIVDNRPDYAQKAVVAIIDTSGGMALSIGQGQVPFKLIALLPRGANTPDAVTNEDTLRVWIDAAHRLSVLSFASRLLVLGFVLNFFGQIVQLELNPKRPERSKEHEVNAAQSAVKPDANSATLDVIRSNSQREAMLKKPADQTLWTDFRRYFDDFIVSDIEKSLQAKIEVRTIILTTVGIECLSGYFAGAETDRKHFVEFMQEFMPAYSTYADDIYACVRNGLAHDYVIKKNPTNNRTFLFKRDHGEPHLSAAPTNPNVIYLNRETYARDFLEAQRQYFARVEVDQTLWDKAMDRLHDPKSFLTVGPEDQLIARLTASSASSGPPSGSAIGLSTGVSPQPPRKP